MRLSADCVCVASGGFNSLTDPAGTLSLDSARGFLFPRTPFPTYLQNLATLVFINVVTQ